jgi:hypothetical protein
MGLHAYSKTRSRKRAKKAELVQKKDELVQKKDELVQKKAEFVPPAA